MALCKQHGYAKPFVFGNHAEEEWLTPRFLLCWLQVLAALAETVSVDATVSVASVPPAPEARQPAAPVEGWNSSWAAMLKGSKAYRPAQLAVDEAAQALEVEQHLARAMAALLALCTAAKLLIVAFRSDTLCCCALLLVLHAFYHTRVSSAPFRALLTAHVLVNCIWTMTDSNLRQQLCLVEVPSHICHMKPWTSSNIKWEHKMLCSLPSKYAYVATYHVDLRMSLHSIQYRPAFHTTGNRIVMT